ncbi:hypothetical protein M8J77_017066 [Diaphorina citri]|nr:hypothetical protein M8J77_017066 [Diaphorina citri]
MSNIVDLIADSVLQDCEVFEYFSDSREFWRLSGLGIFHMNIGRLRSNFNELMLIISPYLVNIDIIILTETWHHPSFPYSFSIPGYNSYFTSQQHNEASGIAVYVRDDLDVQTDELTQFTMTNCLKLDLKLTDKRLTLLTMYRSPSGNNAPRFIEELDQYLSQLTCDRCLLVGDLNINILDQNMTNMGHDYLDILHGHNYIPTITKPTRVKINKRQDGQTFKTESCIDHIMYKSRNINEIRSSIIQTNISDHYSIATKLNLNFDKQTTPTTKQYRHIDFDLLKDKLNNQDWTCITNSDDVNFTANQLTEIIEEHISSSSEIKNYTNRLTPIKPWMTQALLRSIRNRDRLARLTKRNPDNIRLHDYYKRVRNIVSKSIRTARDLDIKRNLDENKDDKRKLWTVIHDVINKTNKKSKIKTITHDNTDYNCDTDTTHCANIINNYFSNVGKNISDSITLPTLPTNNDAQDQQPTYPLLSTFDTTTTHEVYKTVMSFKNNSAPGHDGLQTKLLKQILPYILTPLTKIINLSMTKGQFPDSYKNSIIVPIHKKGNTKQLTNYRPISLLTMFSKVLEKIIKTRLDKYLQTYNVLTDRQYGFRRGIGTEDTLIDLTTYLYDNMDRGQKVIACFLDIAKAYDSIQHDKLLQELRSIGLTDTALTWFTSYLTNRTQQVRLNSQLSDKADCLPYSIVQGSCLGPCLFNCFINKLPGKSMGQVFCYADDAVICYASDSWEETHNLAATDLTNIANSFGWMSWQEKGTLLPWSWETGSEGGRFTEDGQRHKDEEELQGQAPH